MECDGCHEVTWSMMVVKEYHGCHGVYQLPYSIMVAMECDGCTEAGVAT